MATNKPRHGYERKRSQLATKKPQDLDETRQFLGCVHVPEKDCPKIQKRPAREEVVLEAD